jgi:hypothetical protein
LAKLFSTLPALERFFPGVGSEVYLKQHGVHFYASFYGSVRVKI